MPRLPKFLLLIFSVINLILGMVAGMGRLGWTMPLQETYIHHGAIMVGGFLGTLIALEKVIPLKRKVFYAGPLISAFSVVLFGFGQFEIAVMMLVVSGVLFVMVYCVYLSKQYNRDLLLAMVGALCWLVGNVFLLWKRFYPAAFPWWMGFLLFTIVSERLELSKFLPVSRRIKNLLIAFLILFIAGILLPFHGEGMVITGISLVMISTWMMRYDVIHLTIRKSGLLRFMAIALLCGYIALLFEGVLLIFSLPPTLLYDMLVHTFFLGFAFMMIFAHGPVIIPGVLGLAIKPYHPFLYVPMISLLGSLLLRIAADAEFISLPWRSFSGWITAASILLYFVTILVLTVREWRKVSKLD